MSIILRNYPTSLNSGAGGSEEGFPPSDITIISTTVNDGQVLIKWSDPDDTIINGTTISKWASTVLIRNDSHYPSSIDDGILVINNTTKNAYKDTWYTDTGLTNNHTYYYRFFTYSTDNIYNNSGNLMFKATPLSFAPIFGDNTWTQIAAASESGFIPDTWSVGDEISIPLSGVYTRDSLTLQIYDFNHYDKSDGSGKAGILIGSKGIPYKVKFAENETWFVNYGDPECTITSTYFPNILSSMPQELQNVIKTVTVYSRNYNSEGNEVFSLNTKLILPSLIEVAAYGTDYTDEESHEYAYPIFTDNASRIKSGACTQWWLRDVANSYMEPTYHYGIESNGDYDGIVHIHIATGPIILFNV